MADKELSTDVKTDVKNQNSIEVLLSDGRKITVRKPKLRDIRDHFDIKNGEERQVHIVSSLSQMTLDELEELDYSDFILLGKAAESFL